MFVKRIYFSGGSALELQEFFLRVPGVAAAVLGLLRPEGRPSSVEEIPGVRVEYDPKKVDISQLMDLFFTVIDPHREWPVQRKSLCGSAGVYYEDGEDQPLVEYHMNFIRNRGKPQAVTDAALTLNDPLERAAFARPCRAEAGLLEYFSVLPAAELAGTEPVSPQIDLRYLEVLGVICPAEKTHKAERQ